MTALGTTAQFGIGKETVWGTGVTPTRFYPVINPTVDPGQSFVVSEALRSDRGRVRLASARGLGKKDAKSSFTVDINNKGFGMLLRAILGGVSTSQPNAGSDPTVYDHTFTIADALESYTQEVAWLDDASNPYALKATGAIVNTAEISVTPDEIASCAIECLCKTVLTPLTSRTSASYISGLTPFTGGTTSVTLGGVAAESVLANVKIDNQLDGDRYNLGGGGARNQPIPGLLQLTAELEGDFKDWTAYNRVLNNTNTTLVITMDGAVISHAYTYRLQITMNVATVGDAPKLDGPGRIPQPLKLEAYDDGSGVASAISVLLRTTDAAP